MATCYRHSNRETGVSCSNCGNPICPDCMTATPVGMRCPECAKQKTKVKTVASIHGGDPIVTYVIMAICVLAFFAGSGGQARADGVLFGPSVSVDGEYWRLITYGFLHAQPPFGYIHIGFNMYILYFLGTMLEPSLGRLRFAALYFTALLGGAFGAILLDPLSGTVGASGAVFGLMGAAFVMQRARGIDPMQSGIGPLIVMNLALGFVIPNVSIGGHVGGLAAGIAAAYVIEEIAQRRMSQYLAVAGCVAIAAVSVAGAVMVGDRGLTTGLSVVTSLL